MSTAHDPRQHDHDPQDAGRHDLGRADVDGRTQGGHDADARSAATGHDRAAHAHAQGSRDGEARDGEARDGEARDVDVNESHVEDRRGAAEEGRQMRLSVNTAFAEQIGPEGVESYVSTLVAIGESHRGADLSDTQQALTSAFERAGIAVPEIEVARLAEHLSDSTRADLVVAMDDGRVLHGDDRYGVGGNPSARQEEPGDPDRPVYS